MVLQFIMWKNVRVHCKSVPNYYIHKQNLLTTTFARLSRTSAGVSSIMINEQTPQSLFVYQQHPLGVGAKTAHHWNSIRLGKNTEIGNQKRLKKELFGIQAYFWLITLDKSWDLAYVSLIVIYFEMDCWEYLNSHKYLFDSLIWN